MSHNTKISWADATWSPIVGCSKISAGCANCYAEKMALRLAAIECSKPYAEAKYLNVVTSDKATKGWTGQTHFVESAPTKPLHWRTPRTIFVCSMSDLFLAPFEWIDKIFGTMIHCNARRKAMGEYPHIFKLLTKRSKGMVKYYESKPWVRVSRYCEEKWGWLWGAGKLWYPAHVHLGVTVENEDNVGRIADLIRTPAAQRFISFEPLLEKIDFNQDLYDGRFFGDMLDYAFIGCESGPKARLCTLDDIQFMMGQCNIAGGFIKRHVKQIPLNGRCNKHIEQWPKEFQVREV